MKKIRSVFMYVFVVCMMLSVVGCSSSDELKVIKGDNTIIIKGKYLITEKKDKYGIMDLKKKQIVKNKYDDLNYSARTQLYSVKKDGKWGMINEKEEEIIPIKYSFLDKGEGKEIYASNSKQTVVYDKKGKVLKTFEFAVLTPLGNDTFLGAKKATYDDYIENYIGSDFELVDREGKSIKALDYDEIMPLYDTQKTYKDGKAMSLYVKKGNECGVLNLEGEILIPMITSLEKYTNETGVEEVSFMENMDYNSYTKSYLVIKDEKYGVYDNTGKILLDFNYDQIDSNSNGYFATVNSTSEKDYLNTYYYFDLQGKEMFQEKGFMAQPFSNTGYASVMGEEGTSIINKKGEKKDLKVLDKPGISVDEFDGLGRAGIRYYDGAKQYFGLIDDKGKFVIKPIKMSSDSMSFITFMGENDEGFNKYRAIDGSNKEELASTNYVVFTYKNKKNKKGMEDSVFDKSVIYDKDGKKLGSVDAMIIEAFSNGMLLASKAKEDFEDDLKVGLVGKDGKLLTKVNYNFIEEYDDYFYAEKGSKHYIMDKENGEIIFKY